MYKVSIKSFMSSVVPTTQNISRATQSQDVMWIEATEPWNRGGRLGVNKQNIVISEVHALQWEDMSLEFYGVRFTSSHRNVLVCTK